MNRDNKKGWVFNIQRYSVQDGPGIRTTVFSKGCPLKCSWCSNPESQNMHPQLLYFESLCVRCYRCVASCPHGATKKLSDGSIAVDRSLCKGCGICVETCPSEARVISGTLMTPEEVCEIVKKDDPFYRNSDGGMTLSGGEPTYQPEFAGELLKRCYESVIHTCLDTCGYVQWEGLEKMLEYVDLVLFDCKHMDTLKHKEKTGIGNELVLENLERIAGKGKPPVIIRVPLIPGYNDTKDNIEALGKTMAKLGLPRVDLLPYHKLGAKKYERLGMKYKLENIKSFKKEEVERIQRSLESYDLEVNIV